MCRRHLMAQESELREINKQQNTKTKKVSTSRTLKSTHCKMYLKSIWFELNVIKLYTYFEISPLVQRVWRPENSNLENVDKRISWVRTLWVYFSIIWSTFSLWIFIPFCSTSKTNRRHLHSIRKGSHHSVISLGSLQLVLLVNFYTLRPRL